MIYYDKNLSNGHLCKLLVEEGKFVSDGNDIFKFEEPFFLRISPDKIRLELRKLMTPDTRLEISSSKLDAIIELIRDNPSIQIEEERNTGTILFRNGSYCVDDDKLHPYGLKRYTWAKVDAVYKEGVTIEQSPNFLRFVQSSLDYDTTPEKTDLLLEIIGYILSDYTTAKKAFFFIGEPSSGKSKMLEFLQKLLGDEDVTQIPLSKIGGRFNIGQLRGKRLNVCTELASDKFPPLDSFKALTSCDRVYGELKGHDGFSFYPKVKLICAGNSVPVPTCLDGSTSVMDRMVFLLFNHSIPRDQWNFNLVEDLLSERDLICSLAVQKLPSLVQSNYTFTVPKDSETFAQTYSETLQAFELFLCETCELDEKVHVSSQILWERYQEFCHDNGFPIGINQQLFVQKVCRIDGIKKRRIREGGKQITAFYGINLQKSDLSYRKRSMIVISQGERRKQI